MNHYDRQYKRRSRRDEKEEQRGRGEGD